MPAPDVRTLDQLMLETNAAYDPMRQSYKDMINQSGQQLVQQEQGLNAAKDNAFGNITQAAVNKNMLFSGFSPDQQAKYTAEKYLPALAGLRTANQNNISKLDQSIMGLDSEQRKNAMSMREQDLSKLYDYGKEQDRRAWESQQAQQAYEREMAKMREQAALSSRASSAAAGSQTPASDVLNLFKTNWGSSKGTASRQQQDQWVYTWMLNNGIVDPGAQQQVWNLVNREFSRSSDPRKDRMWKR